MTFSAFSNERFNEGSAMRTLTIPGLLALLVFTAGCTVKSTEAPPLSGPSELGLRLNLSLAPDEILQDGQSQTTLNIDATNGDQMPVRGLAMRIDMSADGLPYDLGTLSTKTVVTGDDGKARVFYTAPPKELDGVGHLVTFLVTPIGSDYRGQIARQVDLRLLHPDVIQPPNGQPVPDFTFAPTDPKVLDVVNFNASTSQDEGVACGMRCTYTWDFGDRTDGVRTVCDPSVPGCQHLPGRAHRDRCAWRVGDGRQDGSSGRGHTAGCSLHLLAGVAAGGRRDLLEREQFDRGAWPPHRLLRVEFRNRLRRLRCYGEQGLQHARDV